MSNGSPLPPAPGDLTLLADEESLVRAQSHGIQQDRKKRKLGDVGSKEALTLESG